MRRGLRAFMFNRFSITRPTCDGQTDRQTEGRTDGRIHDVSTTLALRRTLKSD